MLSARPLWGLARRKKVQLITDSQSLPEKSFEFKNFSSSGEDQLPRVQPGRPLARDKVLPVKGEGGELPDVPKVNCNLIKWENGVCNNATFLNLQQERLPACVDRPHLLLPRWGGQRHRLPGGESMRDAHKDGGKHHCFL